MARCFCPPFLVVSTATLTVLTMLSGRAPGEMPDVTVGTACLPRADVGQSPRNCTISNSPSLHEAPVQVAFLDARPIVGVPCPEGSKYFHSKRQVAPKVAGIPSNGDQVHHLEQAINHLRLAGLSEQAEELEEKLNERRAAQRRELAAKREQLRQLQIEVTQLEEIVGDTGIYQLNMVMGEFDITRMRALGLDVSVLSSGSINELLSEVGESHRRRPSLAATPERWSDEMATLWSLTPGTRKMLLSKLPQSAKQAESPIQLTSHEMAARSPITTIVDCESFSALLDALSNEKLVKIEARPTLVVQAEQPGMFQSGGEFPILTPQPDNHVAVDWREFGVRVEAVVQSLDDGQIRLQLAPELSERNFQNAVTMNGVVVPGVNCRRLNTAVEMKLGETVLLAMNQTNADGDEKLWFVACTPEMVKPFAAASPPPVVPAPIPRPAPAYPMKRTPALLDSIH
ncbi:MAG: hypothetical protein KDA80_22190 [Planctomycetaceae bacterium]|nr:hypothetical protein [Planctomycetaceae bacterium]